MKDSRRLGWKTEGVLRSLTKSNGDYKPECEQANKAALPVCILIRLAIHSQLLLTSRKTVPPQSLSYILGSNVGKVYPHFI